MFLIITAAFPPEQIVTANLSKDIANKLSGLGLDVLVISPRPTRPYGKCFEDGSLNHEDFRHQVLNSYVHPKSNVLGRMKESISFGLACKRFIRKNHSQIDKIYANTWPIFAQFLIIREAKKFNIPIFLHIQDVYPESFTNKIRKTPGEIITRILMPIENYVMTNSYKIICISEDMKRYLTRTRPINSENALVVRNWQDDEFLTRKEVRKNNTDDIFTFMYVGSISNSAGVDLLLRAFDDLGDRFNCRLVIAGSGSEKEYCMKLANGNSKIEFWEAPFDKIPEIQSIADILVLSLRKGIGKTATPSKFTAYLFSKKPVLAAIDEDCDTAKIINKSNCGYVIPPDNEDRLQRIMEKILGTDKGTLSKMGRNGFNYAQQHLSRKSNLEKITKILTV